MNSVFISPESLSDKQDAVEKIEQRTIQTLSTEFEKIVGEVDTAFNKAGEIYPHEVISGTSQSEKKATENIAEYATDLALMTADVGIKRSLISGRIDHQAIRHPWVPDGGVSRVRQALFIDSKTEKDDTYISMQNSQTSLDIRYSTSDKIYDLEGGMQKVVETTDGPALPSTIFIKYNYLGDKGDLDTLSLNKILLVCVPHGYLQSKYNPDEDNAIWRGGREKSGRVRASISDIEGIADWRVQRVRPE